MTRLISISIFLLSLLFSSNSLSHPCDGKVSTEQINEHLSFMQKELLERAGWLTRFKYEPIPHFKWSGDCDTPPTRNQLHHYLLNSNEAKARLISMNIESETADNDLQAAALSAVQERQKKRYTDIKSECANGDTYSCDRFEKACSQFSGKLFGLCQ